MSRLTEAKLKQVKDVVLAELPEWPSSLTFTGTATLVAAKTGAPINVVRGAISLLSDEGKLEIIRESHALWYIRTTDRSGVIDLNGLRASV